MLIAPRLSSHRFLAHIVRRRTVVFGIIVIRSRFKQQSVFAPAGSARQSHGRTQSKNATFSSASRRRGTRSYWEQCFLATSVASSTLPLYPTCAEVALPCSRNGFAAVQPAVKLPARMRKDIRRAITL